MAAWLAVLQDAQKLQDSGLPGEASSLYRTGLETYADDPIAVQWLTFNLMMSESAFSGAKSAQVYLPSILESSLSWKAKLYAIELALASADISDDNSGLYAAVCKAAEAYSRAQLTPDDFNLMSCQAIVRQLTRLYGQDGLHQLFLSIDNEDRFDCIGSHPSRPASLKPPTQSNRLPQVLQRSLENQPPPERALGLRHVGPAFVLKLGDNTVLFDKKGQVLDTPYGSLPAFLKIALTGVFKTLVPGPSSVSGTTLFIGDYFSQALNYCHWVSDGLPRIIVAHTQGLNPDNILGAFEITENFQVETIDRLLQPHQTYISVQATDGLMAIDDLFYADNHSLKHVHHPLYGGDLILVQALRQALTKDLPAPKIRRRLYVPRRHTRVVLNDDAVRACLTPYGFEIVDTDQLSFAEQVEIFSAAEAVVAPHGAALTNLIFARPNCKVLEFFPPFGGSASFYYIAHALGFDYACTIDDTSQGPHRDVGEGIISNTAGIEVDVDFVRRWLDILPDISASH
ncbi:glycosyltransferase family 61 protein [Asticcacaulis sp. BYS171W]|uniref:Glycosyltransferase family 61 protein n=1 Tax=Asticcacaulis aquaticus TaxID=2984212 RepID=A0ABT5HS39_9CAUL|nr:glycosyltransferase family 61 protein [Asticcacaulis aquaticus]MDC7682874.1 glycosyltransferase family 61 protein [Asticcacaulis aquaticus]